MAAAVALGVVEHALVQLRENLPADEVVTDILWDNDNPSGEAGEARAVRQYP
jgi:hypothetical protein